MKKRLLSFAASNSKNSINRQFVQYAAKDINDSELDFIDLNEYEMPIYSIDREDEDGIPKLAYQFLDHIKSCDGLIISFAEHNGREEHRNESIKNLCPLAFLVTDINQQNKTVKDTYTNVFKGFVEQANQQTSSIQSALQTAALMIGGLALAKAINDTSLSDELLIACQEGIATLLQKNEVG